MKTMKKIMNPIMINSYNSQNNLNLSQTIHNNKKKQVRSKQINVS